MNFIRHLDPNDGYGISRSELEGMTAEEIINSAVTSVEFWISEAEMTYVLTDEEANDPEECHDLPHDYFDSEEEQAEAIAEMRADVEALEGFLASFDAEVEKAVTAFSSFLQDTADIDACPRTVEAVKDALLALRKGMGVTADYYEAMTALEDDGVLALIDEFVSAGNTAEK